MEHITPLGTILMSSMSPEDWELGMLIQNTKAKSIPLIMNTSNIGLNLHDPHGEPRVAKVTTIPEVVDAILQTLSTRDHGTPTPDSN